MDLSILAFSGASTQPIQAGVGCIQMHEHWLHLMALGTSK